MIGTPFWGETTFFDTNNLFKRINNASFNENIYEDLVKTRKTLTEKEISLSFLENTYASTFGEVKKIKDFVTLIYVMSKLDLMYIIEHKGVNYLSWCKDTRFNYRDGEIFIPYYVYNYLDIDYKPRNQTIYTDMVDKDVFRLKYEYNIEKYILHKSKNDEDKYYESNTFDTSFVLYDKNTNEMYLLVLEDLPLFSKEEFSLDELYALYKEACYSEVNSLHLKSNNSYYGLNDKIYDRASKGRRYKYGLPLYALKYTPLTYVDVRMYSYRALYNTDEPKNPKMFWERIMMFESFMYGIFATGATPTEHPAKESFEQLGVTLRHVKIGSGEPSLILKHYYKKDSQLPLKSYEWR